MKVFACHILLVLFGVAAITRGAAPAASIAFYRSIAEARAAEKVERPLVIVFGASWCAWCHKMDADTFADPKVATVAGQFLWVKVDIDKEAELAARYGADGVPAAVVVDQKGRVLGAKSGYLPPGKFVDFLTKSLANPRPEELLPDLLERFAKSRASGDERETTERLIEQLGKPARLNRDEILAAIKKKGAKTWPLLLVLMADDRLAVRAAAGGALKHASKAELPFHPFADAAVRQRQIAGWQTWVASHSAGS